MKGARLSEVMSGQMAVTLQNKNLDKKMPFAEVKQKLMTATDLTVSSVTRMCMRPYTEALSKILGVDIVNHAHSLVERMLVNTIYEEVMLALLMGFFNNIGNDKPIVMLANVEINSVDDFVKDVYRCF